MILKVNDTYGHEAGDMTLVCIANIFEAICRKYKVIRWGEEFLIVLLMLRPIGISAERADSDGCRTFQDCSRGSEFFVRLRLASNISGRRRD
ncbi:MAG: diguanylate cyclase domain-containing protein [[Clostridium] scindens]